MPKYQIKVKHIRASKEFYNSEECPQALAGREHFKMSNLNAGVDNLYTWDSKTYISGDFAKHKEGEEEYGYMQFSNDKAFVKANPDADPELVLHEYEYELTPNP